jgi:hypothetical protein
MGVFLARGRLAAIVLAMLTAAPAAAGAVDALHALPILIKVLTYDRNFHSRGSGEFVVLVPAEPSSASARDEIFVVIKTLSLTAIQNRPLKFISVDYKDSTSLDDQVQKTRAQAILAIHGLSPASLKAISDVAQTNQIYTLALDPQTVQSDALALGVEPKEDGKPQVVINLAAAKSVGAVFENSVLKLAKLIQ